MPFRTSPVRRRGRVAAPPRGRATGSPSLTLDRPDKLNAWSWEATRQLGPGPTRSASTTRSGSWCSRPRAGPSAPASTWACPRTGSPAGRRPRRSATTTRASAGSTSGSGSSPSCPSRSSAPSRATASASASSWCSCATSGIAADDAMFALPEAQVGVAIDAGGDLRLAHEVGAGWAKLLALTGRRIDAADRRAARHRPAGHRRPRTWSRRPWRMAARDRRQRPAGRAEHQAHHRRLRLPRPDRGAQVRGHVARRSSSSPTTCRPATPPRRQEQPVDFEGK